MCLHQGDVVGEIQICYLFIVAELNTNPRAISEHIIDYKDKKKAREDTPLLDTGHNMEIPCTSFIGPNATLGIFIQSNDQGYKFLRDAVITEDFPK